jgi:hypothetical protein
MMNLSKISNTMTVISLFIISFGVQIIKLKTIDFMLFALPWSIVFMMIAYYAVPSLSFHVSYFHLTCYYLNLRVARVRKRFKRHKSQNLIKNDLLGFKQLLEYINCLNQTFWQPILMVLCFPWSGVGILNVYQIFYSQASLIFRIVYFQFVIFDFQLVSFIVLSASQLSSSISRIHLDLNQISIKSKIENIQFNLKVKYYFNFIKN